MPPGSVSALREQLLGWKGLKVVFRGDGIERDMGSRGVSPWLPSTKCHPETGTERGTAGFPPGKGVPNPKGSREAEEERIGLFSQ